MEVSFEELTVWAFMIGSFCALVSVIVELIDRRLIGGSLKVGESKDRERECLCRRLEDGDDEDG